MSQQFRNQLKAYKKKNGMNTPHPKSKKQRPAEHFSQQDLEDLMGMHRPTYQRGRGGAIKQK